MVLPKILLQRPSNFHGKQSLWFFINVANFVYFGPQWLKCGGTQGNAVPTPPVFSPKRSPSQISKKRRGTLRRTLRYADVRIIAIIMTVSNIIDRHNTVRNFPCAAVSGGDF